jgi:hypothetical protein
LMKAHNPAASNVFCCNFHKLAFDFTRPMAFCLLLS